MHETILKGVQKIPSSGSENLLIKLKQSFFGLNRDLVVCFSYCVPENSSYQLREQLDIYGDLELKLSSVGQHVDKLCLGDFNARTAQSLDYLESEDNTDLPIPLDIYETDCMNHLQRQNLDRNTNKYGDNLLSLCKSVPLCICNGRKLGDILGSYTCYTPNGQSSVDYCLVSPRLFDSVQTFSVGQVSALSDHCPIRAVLSVNIFTSNIQEHYNYIEIPKKLPWSAEIAVRFENLLQSPEFKVRVEKNLLNQNCDYQEGIDEMTETLTNILVEGATLANVSQRNKLGNSPKRKKVIRKKNFQPKWHDLSCEEARRKVSASARLLKNNPSDQSLGARLRNDVKNYKKIVKLRNKQFIDNMFCELDSMENNNPRGYMDIIRSMRDGSFDKKTSDDTSGVSPTKWHAHFSNLLAKNVNKDDKLEQYILNNIDFDLNELNEPFLLEELSEALKGLKNNKSSSFDTISNEMLKTGGKFLKGAFLKLFNSIQSSSFFPTIWKKDILHPIHKSDEKNDPNNFRGIAISSCFGKLFTKLLKNRLQLYCDKNNIAMVFTGVRHFKH